MAWPHKFGAVHIGTNNRHLDLLPQSGSDDHATNGDAPPDSAIFLPAAGVDGGVR